MKKTTEVKKIDKNLIYVVRKTPMSYILTVVTQFNGNGTKNVIIKSRDRSISTVVDTAEIVRNRFGKNTKEKEITINTKSPKNEDKEYQMFHQLKYVLQQSRRSKREHNTLLAWKINHILYTVSFFFSSAKNNNFTYIELKNNMPMIMKSKVRIISEDISS